MGRREGEREGASDGRGGGEGKTEVHKPSPFTIPEAKRSIPGSSPTKAKDSSYRHGLQKRSGGMTVPSQWSYAVKLQTLPIRIQARKSFQLIRSLPVESGAVALIP